VLGIAKLLPQVVAVKRETLQVVSLAMTGLVRGSGPIFHTMENRRRSLFVEWGILGPYVTAGAGVAVGFFRPSGAC